MWSLYIHCLKGDYAFSPLQMVIQESMKCIHENKDGDEGM